MYLQLDVSFSFQIQATADTVNSELAGIIANVGQCTASAVLAASVGVLK